MTTDRGEQLVGLVPAAGSATRLGPIPCSKAILPVAGEGPTPGSVRVACHSLLEQLAAARVDRCLVVVDREALDVAAYVGDGTGLGLDVGYLTIDDSPSTVATLARATRHVGASTVVLGFPDIQLSPGDLVARTVDHHRTSGADVVLGLVPATDTTAVDVVAVDDDGRVTAVVPKPAQTDLTWMWPLAVWGPRFTTLLADHARRPHHEDGELFVGHVVTAAITAGLRVEATHMPDGRYLDVGTPATLAVAQEAPWPDAAGEAPAPTGG